MIDFRDYCQNCGKALPIDRYSTWRLFCCTACKIADRCREEREAIREAKRGRLCAFCDGPVAIERPAYAVFCSKPCQRRAWYQDKIAPAKRDARRGRPCGICEGEIPIDLKAGTLYCGADCQAEAQRRAVRRYRARRKV